MGFLGLVPQLWVLSVYLAHQPAPDLPYQCLLCIRYHERGTKTMTVSSGTHVVTQCDGSYDEYGQHAWKLPVAPGEVREGFTEDGRLERNLKT